MMIPAPSGMMRGRALPISPDQRSPQPLDHEHFSKVDPVEIRICGETHVKIEFDQTYGREKSCKKEGEGKASRSLG